MLCVRYDTYLSILGRVYQKGRKSSKILYYVEGFEALFNRVKKVVALPKMAHKKLVTLSPTK